MEKPSPMDPTSLLLRCEDRALGPGLVGDTAALLAKLEPVSLERRWQDGVVERGLDREPVLVVGTCTASSPRSLLIIRIITKGKKAQRKAAYLGHRAT